MELETMPWRSIAQLVWYLFILFYVAYSLVLYYHWHNYSLHDSATRLTYIAYFGLSLPLLVIMGLMIQYL